MHNVSDDLTTAIIVYLYCSSNFKLLVQRNEITRVISIEMHTFATLRK